MKTDYSQLLGVLMVACLLFVGVCYLPKALARFIYPRHSALEFISTGQAR